MPVPPPAKAAPNDADAHISEQALYRGELDTEPMTVGSLGVKLWNQTVKPNANFHTAEQALHSRDLGANPSIVRKSIIFVRHGESEYNKAMRTTGRDPQCRDAPLTETGRHQASGARKNLAELRARLEKKLPEGPPKQWLLVVSPLRRTLDTAMGIWPEAFLPDVLEGTAGANVRVQLWPSVRENMTGCGDMGSSPRVLIEAYPHLWPQLVRLPDVWWTLPPELDYLPAEGEAMMSVYAKDPEAFESCDEAGMHERLRSIAQSLADAPEELIVVVSHCNLIGLFTEYVGLTEMPSLRPGWWLRNCECREVEGLKLYRYEDPSKEGSDKRKNLLSK